VRVSRHRRIQATGILILMAGLPCAALAGAFAGRRQAPGATPPENAAPPPAGPGENTPPPPAPREAPPEDLADFTVRTYKIKPRKLWKALLPALEAAGHPLEEVDEEGLSVRTAFVDFLQKSFGEQVAEPPRRFGPDFPVIMMKYVVEGKVSLEAIVSKASGGAALKIRARILVQGLDRRQKVMLMVDRRSSGIIEAEFLGKLEEELGLKRI
jgi:hypothetical protein